MKREVDADERGIRDGIVDILCFLSHDPSGEQIAAIRAKIDEALAVFRTEEQVNA